MKTFIFFFVVFSCSFSTEKVQKERSVNFWWILENYDSISWTKEKIASLLGTPNQVLTTKNETNWIYRDPDTKHQIWAIGISNEDKVSGLAYLPEKNLLIIEVEERWKSKECKHKKETVLIAGHHYTPVRTFFCDSGKIEVIYNRYNEVERIFIK